MSSASDLDLLVCNEPGAIRFDYERQCQERPTYSIWLWNSWYLTLFDSDGAEREVLSVEPQDLISAAIAASGFGHVVSWTPIPVENVELRNDDEVEHVLTHLAGDVHDPIRWQSEYRWWVIGECWQNVKMILRLPWMRDHGGYEVPGCRNVIEFEWRPE